MFFEILLSTTLGIVIGMITGLIPGFHPNNAFVMVLSLSPLLFFSTYPVLAFIVSLAVSNSFFDFIPSIFFGAPEEDSVLSVLPGHKLLLKGNGYEALFLTVMGGLGVMLLTLASLPALFYFIPIIYFLIRPYLHYLLLAIVIWMILMEKGRRKAFAITIFLLVGLFGFISLNSLPSQQALFPALTSLFGISTLTMSILTKVRIPKQMKAREIREDWIKGSMTGWLAGLLAGLLPGVGSSQAGIIAAQFLRAKLKEFMIALGGINTSNIFFTFIVFYVIGKTRSGAVWALSQIVDKLTMNDVYLIITIGLISCFISVVLTLKIGSLFLDRMKRISYTKLTTFTLAFLIILIFIFSGFIGLLISATGVFLGLLTISLGIRRTHLMGFLLFPTIVYFAGLNPILMITIGL
jgi:putative membrane protein